MLGHRKRRSPAPAPNHSPSPQHSPRRPRWFCCHKTQIVTLAKQTLNGMRFVILGEEAAREHMLTVCCSGAGLEPRPRVATRVVLELLPRAARALQPPSPMSGSSWHEIKGCSAQLFVSCSPTGPNSRAPALDSHRKSPIQPHNSPTYYHMPASGRLH